MAMQLHPKPLMKLSFVIRAGKKGYTHAPEQLWASSLPCPTFAWLSFRQDHQPGAASHTLRNTHAQERCTAIYARDDNSTVLTHSGFVPESAAVTREKKATHNVGLGLQSLKAQPQQWAAVRAAVCVLHNDGLCCSGESTMAQSESPIAPWSQSWEPCCFLQGPHCYALQGSDFSKFLGRQKHKSLCKLIEHILLRITHVEIIPKCKIHHFNLLWVS